MKNISKAKLMTISIPVPPLDIQRKFGKFALAQHKTLTARREGAETTASLFGSLVQRAFRGEL
jgi:type I restriction enzyme S subunit